MKGYNDAMRYMSMMVGGCLFAIFVGNYIDEKLNTTPWIMIAILAYVIIGSLVLLVKG